MNLTPAIIKQKIRYLIFRTVDVYYDMRICGKNLCEYVPSVYRDDKNGIGFTGSESTRYGVLKKIFKNVKISESDVFMDVGCGKGRVLAFCIKENYPCSINGIEINEVPGKIAVEWTQKYDNVHVTIGDAFTINYNQYTILFLGRPFLPKTFAVFINLIESQLTHPITFIYWVDQQSGNYLYKRDGWAIKEREIIKEIYGIKLLHGPRGYSIWEYTPPQ